MNANLPGNRSLRAIACFFLILSLLATAGAVATTASFTGTSADMLAKGPSTKDLKNSMMSKVDTSLLQLSQEYRAWLDRGGEAAAGPFRPTNTRLPLRPGNSVVVDATAQTEAGKLVTDLERLGCTKIASFQRVVSATCPIAAIETMGKLDSLNFARAASASTDVGVVDSQGDAAMRADVARSLFGVDGSGIVIGSLSDSYNCYGGAATDVANGDLPAGIVVLDDVTGAGCSSSVIDEGRGIFRRCQEQLLRRGVVARYRAVGGVVVLHPAATLRAAGVCSPGTSLLVGHNERALLPPHASFRAADPCRAAYGAFSAAC